MKRTEPLDFEKAMLRAIAEELVALRDEDKDEAALIRIGIQSGIEALKGERFDSRAALRRALADAANTRRTIVNALHLYEGSREILTPQRRALELRDYILSLKDYEYLHMANYTELSDQKRAEQHLLDVCGYAREAVSGLICKKLVHDSNPHARDTRMDMHVGLIGARTPVPLAQYPELAGVYIVNEQFVALAQSFMVLLMGAKAKEIPQIYFEIANSASVGEPAPAPARRAGPAMLHLH